jgi:trigger factor
VAVKPEVTLGVYKGIEVNKSEQEVTEDEITAEIDKARDLNARLITIDDRPVADGDEIKIDFEGFIDGVPFEGGKAEDHALKIGSHSFIDTFEDQLIGKSIGEDVQVNVTFPENYQAQELAGKEALFEVKINEIRYRELPEADDDFAQDISDFDTFDAYKENIREKLAETKQKSSATKTENEALDKLVEISEMEIPKAMIDTSKEDLLTQFRQRLQYQGLTLEQYFAFSHTQPTDLDRQLTEQAEKQIKSRLVLEAVAKQENIEASEEDIENDLAELAKGYGMGLDTVKERFNDKERANLAENIKVRKALELIAAAVTVKE